MSIRVLSQVWEMLGLDPHEKLVMLALADHADDAGVCYPSIARLCERTGMKERGVQMVLKRLREKRMVQVQVGGGRRATSLYRIIANPALDAGKGISANPAPDAPAHEKPRIQNPVSDAETPHSTALNPAPGAPEPSGTVRVEVGAGREREPALLSRVLEAVGLNPNDRLPTHWMPPTADMHVQRWVSAGIPADTVVEIAAENRKRHPDPPNGPKALDHAMRAWLAASAAPAFSAPVIPLETGHPDARRSSRPSRSDAALRAFLSGA